MQTFHCDHCGHLVFFENVFCEVCGHALGYLTDLHTMSSLEPAENGLWCSLNPNATGYRYRMCSNYALEDVCNWMLPAHDPNNLCASCRLTEIIPALGMPQHRTYWYRMEQAKRRLLYTLSTLGLVPVSRAEDPGQGLAFRFLADSVQSGPITTCHDNGIITLNIAEADDVQRECTRAQLGEPRRSLLGHFHHEIGHYYWDRLIGGGVGIAMFRQLFGDEQADYDASLKRYYEQGPQPDWPQRFVTAYASAHPWEDWAETWAQYLQMVDALETVLACGLVLTPANPNDPVLVDGAHTWSAGSFDQMLERWFPLSYVLNNLHRSLGMPDAYQFSLAAPVIAKLRFVHEVVTGR